MNVTSETDPSQQFSQLREQHENYWQDLRNEFVSTEQEKARLYLVYKECYRLWSSSDFHQLYAKLRAEGFPWFGLSVDNVMRRITFREIGPHAKIMELIIESQKFVLSVDLGELCRFSVRRLAEKLKELLEDSRRVRGRLENFERQTRNGVICHKCLGLRRVVLELGYDREGRAAQPHARMVDCNLCDASGKLQFGELHSLELESQNIELDQMIDEINPESLFGESMLRMSLDCGMQLRRPNGQASPIEGSLSEADPAISNQNN